MKWLDKVVDEALARKPEGEILVESGGSPSGAYHLGHLRELVTCDAIMLEIRRRGHQSRHVYYVDDLDGLRKIPGNIPADYKKYLGMPLCDIPAPDGSDKTYAEYFTQDLIKACEQLGIEVEFIFSHTKYHAGFFVPAIEKALDSADKVKEILETVSGHKLGTEWSPIQVNEGDYLKKRRFMGIDRSAKTIDYEDLDGKKQSISYAKGDVKLDWRIDWPARWWLLSVDVEPAGRDHATKGGSFDTGLAICKDVFGVPGPVPVPYDFVNLAGDPKKMSASRGTGVGAAEAVEILPPQVVRFFNLRYPPSKRLYLDTMNIYRLIDEYEEFAVKKDKSEDEETLSNLCEMNLKSTVSSVPFSHLVASYQAGLKDPDRTIELLRRNTKDNVDSQAEVIKQQLKFVNNWLDNWAPEDVKFDLAEKVDSADFSDKEKDFMAKLAAKIEQAPADADGEWFHKAIYDFQDSLGMEPKETFQTLYKALIGKNSGPRAGWFLSILPRDWLLKRLKFEA